MNTQVGVCGRSAFWTSSMSWYACLCLCLVIAAGCGNPPEEVPASSAADVEDQWTTQDSFDLALVRVERALAALGGENALHQVEGLTMRGEGSRDLTLRLQGLRPGEPTEVPVQEELVIDFRTGVVAFETHGQVNPDADEWLRFVYDDAGRLLIVDALAEAAFWVPVSDGNAPRYARRVPHVLLREALEQRHTLRHLGSSGGAELVHMAFPSGESLTLRFDAANDRLSGFEYLLDLPVYGDSLVRWTFDPPQPVEGLGELPGGYRIEVAGETLQTMRYTSIETGPVDPFDVPAGVTVPEPPPAEPPPTATAEAPAETPNDLPDDLPSVRELADGVYLAVGVRGGFHVLFVELDDSVVVVDAPAGYHELQMVPAVDWAGDVTSSSVARRLLRAVRATVPDKPIQLVLTHHHGDHLGGVRPFLAAGAEIFATEPTAQVVRRAAASKFSLVPDELSSADRQGVDVEIVHGETTLGSGERTVRVIDVGENPHSEGLLVVYVPHADILYQSDLFMPSSGSFPDPARIPVMRFFVDWLDRSGLEPERIYAIHGSARVTPEQLDTIRSPEAKE